MPPKRKTKEVQVTVNPLVNIWQRYCSIFDSEILPLLPGHERVLNSIVSTWDSTIPNLLVYGSPGMPFFPIWNYLVLAPMKRRLVDMSFQHSVFTYGASHMPYTETDIYLHVDLSHPDMPRDGDALFEFLKAVLPSRCMHLHKHIVILENIDVLTGCGSSFAQVMRVLLERYSSNVWFVATTNRVGSLESPILSRFLSIRIPLPSICEVSAILKLLNLPEPSIPTRNLTDALTGHGASVTKFKSPMTLQFVREEAQRLLQINAPLALVCLRMLENMPEKKRAAALDKLVNIEAAFHTRRKGRDIIYYEALLLVL